MNNKTRSTLAAIGLFIVAKSKWVYALLKLTKFGGTLISMAISLGAYAAFYGWKFGVALVYLIFVHEMGHLIAAKQKGIATSPAVFIPFMGALISLKERPRSAATEAYLAYGGPLAGLISFLPAVVLYEWNGDPFWALVVYLGALINLFNMLPISPLDGGRIVSVLSTKIWLVGLLILVAVILVTRTSPLMYLVLLIGAFTWWNRAREGFRASILSYEREKLGAFRSMIADWPSLTSTYELKAMIASDLKIAQEHAAGDRKWSIPFLHDREKYARDTAKIDLFYGERTLRLLQEWEHQPVQYEDGDASRPIPSPLLSRADREIGSRSEQVDEELKRYRTYYVAPNALKWKVLAAYLALAGVLSYFMIYGFRIMELHR
ncbi:MAG: site-2 protease family protein [Candidatus Cohnella colombiensis]|uniref:Site-2 protease family protein n=1 Tax=Candidatus Cohnella colombiensis TaxID=3121368 RepID=A0AA95F0P4_9BACL|nr:MAG: site-2 protease family protein [Cohnella sp.]